MVSQELREHHRVDNLREYDEIDYCSLARCILKTKRGVGMTPPFYAESNHARNDPDWFWMVRNSHCKSVGFIPKRVAEKLSSAMNELYDEVNSNQSS